MKQLTTATGSPFQFKEHPNGDIIVYSADGNGQLQAKSAIVITPFTIGLVKKAIQQKGRILVGASRDQPPAGSLGALLKAEKQSPQQLSYLVPILVDQGFCSIGRDGRAIVVIWRST